MRDRLAIPVGAELRPTVKSSSPATFETAPSRTTPMLAAEGFEAAVKPLCLKCHPME